MRLIIGAVGRMKPSPENSLFDDYVDRIAKSSRSLGFSGIETFEIEAAKDRDVTARRRRESDALIARLRPEALICALDERGKPFTSVAFSEFLAAARDRGEPSLAFLIGGADGHGDSVLAASRRKMAFGPATWPHMLVRAMLAEQLYRALTILSGHPYHRE